MSHGPAPGAGSETGPDATAQEVVTAQEPARGIDPDVDLTAPSQLRELTRRHGAVLLVVAAGGVIGSLLRYQAGLFWPTAPGTFPATTFAINLLGCLIIGIFMVVITEIWTAHRLVRPFFGTGVLGGFTTFSTYSLDVSVLLRTGQPGTALTYLAATAVGAMIAVAVGMLTTRRLVGLRRRR